MKLHTILTRTVLPATLCCLSSLSLSSCADTDTEQAVEPQEPETTQNVNIALNIPKTIFGSSYTRADEKTDPLAEGEGTISSLYLVTYISGSANGNYRHHSTVDLRTVTPSPITDVSSEKEYNFYLEKGFYKFYLFANFLDYYGDTQANFENAIQNIARINDMQLRFDGPLDADNLPMVCFPENISIKKNGVNLTGANGILEIDSDDVIDADFELTAPLTILCSKVRYTVLYDNAGNGEENFSKDFPKNSQVNFTGEIKATDSEDVVTKDDGVTFSYVCNQTPVVAYTTSVGISNSSMFLDSFTHDISQVFYPSASQSNGDDTYKYLSINSYDKSPQNLTKLDAPHAWPDYRKRAWQGSVLYLPENTQFTSGTDKETTFHLSATGEGTKADGYDISIPNMTRGHFYDIVAKLKDSQQVALEIKVVVNAWKYNPSDVMW